MPLFYHMERFQPPRKVRMSLFSVIKLHKIWLILILVLVANAKIQIVLNESSQVSECENRIRHQQQLWG